MDTILITGTYHQIVEERLIEEMYLHMKDLDELGINQVYNCFYLFIYLFIFKAIDIIEVS